MTVISIVIELSLKVRHHGMRDRVHVPREYWDKASYTDIVNSILSYLPLNKKIFTPAFHLMRLLLMILSMRH